jgi:methylenetetrahydrofolate dehydrogenase (NADP+)/methenyltetrahydrofolate cyclohydrolase
MIVDGRAIAEKILSSVATQTADATYVPKLGIITCAPNAETKQYLDLKQRKAKAVGIELVVLELPLEATTADCVAATKRLAQTSHGVVVQLPLPEHIDRETVLAAVPVEQDPDGFAYGRDEHAVLPPVAGAIDYIVKEAGLSLVGKRVVVLGEGRLVGQPCAKYATAAGARVTILTEHSADYASQLLNAEVLITGIGKPHFITADMVKAGVVVFDAGASEDSGEIVGDVDPNVAEKASLFTPVPGGIGPITVAVLLQNVVGLARS